jgi:uncharacterized protein (DUF433 family)
MTTRVVSEEEKMRRVPGIIFVDGATGRRARVQGTGLEVFEIIHGYKVVGEDLEGLLRAFHWLKAEQILAALDYYRAFPGEIDAKLEEGRLAAEAAAGPEPPDGGNRAHR